MIGVWPQLECRMTTIPFPADDAPAIRRLAAAACVAASAAILGAGMGDAAAVDGWRVLHWLCKPLATGLILWLVWRAAAPVSAHYRRRILAGMVFSLIGDVFLMLSARWFVAGLLGFLLAHLCFIAAFVADKPLRARPLPWLLCLGYGALAVWLLWPQLPPPLRVAVPAYIAVLASMGGQAVGRAQWLQAARDPRTASARLAAIGALAFMLSDSLLAWNRFMAPLPCSALWVLATYYVALWLIGLSVYRSDAFVTVPRRLA